jgi:hypothetical protein
LDVSLSRLLLGPRDANISNNHNDINQRPPSAAPTSEEEGAVRLVAQLLLACPLLDARYLLRHCGGSPLHPQRNQILDAFATAEAADVQAGVQVGARIGAGGGSGLGRRGMLGGQRRSPRCAGVGVSSAGQGRMSCIGGGSGSGIGNASGNGGFRHEAPTAHIEHSRDTGSGKKKPSRRRSSV